MNSADGFPAEDDSNPDVGQNLTEKWYTSGALQQTQTFSYDAVGQLLTSVDPDGAYTFTYDALNRTSTVAEPFGLGLTFTYDASDNRTVTEDSKGGLTTMAYDADNRRTNTQFTGNSATLRFDFAYDARDSITKVTRFQNLAGTGTVGWTSFTYDTRGRLTNQQHRDSSNTSLLNTTFAYDNFDRQTVRTIDGAATTYSYNDTNQLTGDGTKNYAYDANGNRTGGGYATGTGNRTSNDGTWTYTYDVEGNRTKRSKGASLESWTYGYDHRNQLVWVEKRATDGGTLQTRVDYKYDAFNRRIERLADADGNGTQELTERFGYDGAHVWVDLDGTNNLIDRRLYGVGVDTPIVRVSSLSAVVWYLTDYQNSVVGQLNSNGGLIGKLTYDGFGNILTDTTGGSGDRYGYTARERDALTGLQYNHNRWYDAALGKWLTMDPIGFSAGDPNLYRYVGNGANNWVDASGLERDKFLPNLNSDGSLWNPTPPKPVGQPTGQPIEMSQQGFFGGLASAVGAITVPSKPSQIAGKPRPVTKPLPKPLAQPNLGGSLYQFYDKPKPGQLIGTGGAGASVGCIIIRPDGSLCVYHFGTTDAGVISSISQYAWPAGSTAIVFGGVDETTSNLLLSNVFTALNITGLPVSYIDQEGLCVDSNGTVYHSSYPPK